MPDPLTPLQKFVDLALETQATHIEMMAAAFLKATNLDPRDAVLCQETKDGVMRWWFEPKTVKRPTFIPSFKECSDA